MAAVPPLKDLMLPTPETYVTLINIFQYFPLVSDKHLILYYTLKNSLQFQFSIIQWLTSFHPAGKTSLQKSSLNIPGRIGWFAMEIVGPINLIYILWKLPPKLHIESLPLQNKLVAVLYILHYVNRAIISPFSAPSMSPIHVLVVIFAVLFNWLNSSCIASWLAGYNVATIPTYRSTPSHSGTSKATEDPIPDPTTPLLLPVLGFVLFVTGMIGNIYSERTLFRLRREEAKKQKKSATKYSKIYVIPPATGLFTSILYPHYVFEWLEWTGFTLVGTAVLPALSLLPLIGTSAPSAPGPGHDQGSPLRLAPWIGPIVAVLQQSPQASSGLPLPGIVFVVNAVTNMLPHARWGRKWYVERFGEEAVGGRGAVVPFCKWM
ncbi:hypothetical protein AOCH_001513 [Aspergillus ochraceoroseus]|uniref:3-oxo-5-alpha-steroid 4-dehydrogenase C-terminal domain-containing protein n=1 Tax=Aspergillus ochraceoroseus TaxID=138278 RepID=A0A0F8U0V7_9EURO|nr:hypothetical protein AOCH_001513 [Aspergillus ochraceoroseus]